MATTTIAAVELVRVGTWHASNGTTRITRDDLHARSDHTAGCVDPAVPAAGEPTQVAATAATTPGTVVLTEATFADLQRMSGEWATQRRDGVIDAALSSGRITPAERPRRVPRSTATRPARRRCSPRCSPASPPSSSGQPRRGPSPSRPGLGRLRTVHVRHRAGHSRELTPARRHRLHPAVPARAGDHGFST